METARKIAERSNERVDSCCRVAVIGRATSGEQELGAEAQQSKDMSHESGSMLTLKSSTSESTA